MATDVLSIASAGVSPLYKEHIEGPSAEASTDSAQPDRVLSAQELTGLSNQLFAEQNCIITQRQAIINRQLMVIMGQNNQIFFVCTKSMRSFSASHLIRRPGS